MKKRSRNWLIALVVLVVLLIIGGWYWHQRQAKQAEQAAQATQAHQRTTAKAANDAVAKQIRKQWVGAKKTYVAADLTAAKLESLQTAQRRAKKMARADADKSAANALALKRLRQAYQQTVRVNALFEAPALVGAKVDKTVQVRTTTTAAKVDAAAPSAVNATLLATLQQLCAVGQKQVAARTTLEAAVAKIADGGTLKTTVTLADLKAFIAVVDALPYPAMADQYASLVTAAKAKIKALNSITSLATADLQRRILYLFGKSFDASAPMQTAASTYVTNGAMHGARYTADLASMRITDQVMMDDVEADVVVAADGKLTLNSHQAGQSKVIGNVMTDTPSDLASQRPAPDRLPTPRVDTDELRAAIIAADEPLDDDATPVGGNHWVGLKNADGTGYIYQTADEGAYSVTFPDDDDESTLPDDFNFDSNLTSEIWSRALGK